MRFAWPERRRRRLRQVSDRMMRGRRLRICLRS